MSCYVVAFTRFRGKTGRIQQAACGRFVDKGEHSVEPTCAECAAYLTQEAADDAETFEALGYEQLQPGVWTPKEA